MTLDEGCRVAAHALQMQTLADCNRIGALSDTGSAGYRRGMVDQRSEKQATRATTEISAEGALGAGQLATRLALRRAPAGTDG